MFCQGNFPQQYIFVPLAIIAEANSHLEDENFEDDEEEYDRLNRIENREEDAAFSEDQELDGRYVTEDPSENEDEGLHRTSFHFFPVFTPHFFSVVILFHLSLKISGLRLQLYF